MLKILMSAAAAALVMGATAGTAAAQDYADCVQHKRQNEAVGTVAGAIVGGVIGNQVFRGERGLGTVGGAVLGGVIGNKIASSGDDCDGYYASRAYRRSFDSGERVEWRNPRSGNYGYIEPAGYYRDDRGHQCRNYQQEIYIHGRREMAEGRACRNPDGSWRVVE